MKKFSQNGLVKKMTKCYCDRCGKIIKAKKSLRWQYVRLYMEEDYDKYTDLCLECYKEIKEFIEQPFKYEEKIRKKIQEENTFLKSEE